MTKKKTFVTGPSRGIGEAAATLSLERWGCNDFVVHNARFIGPGHMDLVLNTPG